MPASRPVGPQKLWLYIVAGLAHAVLMLLAFPPFGFWGCVFLAPLPLIWAAHRRQNLARQKAEPLSTPSRPFRSRFSRARGLIVRFFRSPAALVSLGVLPFHLFAHQWVVSISELGYPPMAVIMSLFYGGFVWLLARIRCRWPSLPFCIAAPLAWVAIEVLRGEVIVDGYPWILIAHPLIDAPFIPAAASTLGIYFLGFLVVAASGAVADFAFAKRRKWGIIGLVTSCGCGAAASLIASNPDQHAGPTLSIAIIQTNIPQSNKTDWSFGQRMRDFQRFSELTRKAAASKPDLIVWPETMFPGLTLTAAGVAEERAAGLSFRVRSPSGAESELASTEFYDGLLRLSEEIKIPMLIGALGMDGLSIKPLPQGGVTFDFKARYNSVFQVSGGVVDPRPYDKLELTPFGEIFPYVNHWPWLQQQILALGANGMAFDLSEGAGPRAFEFKSSEGAVSVVTPICFEGTKSALCRKLVRAAGKGPVVIANLTNDGWFGDFKPGKLQHLQSARWRCVELGVPMIRAANTGISTSIDARGRVVASGVDGTPLASNTDGILSVRVKAATSATLYAGIGNIFGWSVLGIGTALTVVSFFGGSRRSESRDQEART